ncbi:MAG: D-alanine--D-alanine ligase [Alphaproteobacteria bacterium]|nr:D-alanine--D-alanine ligase [Alphaproteobacteria bacterium]
MRIGFVYDLREDYRAKGYTDEQVAEFDTGETVAEIAAALGHQHCEVVRVGCGQALAARLVAGERFDLVFSIAEGLKGRSREAQVPALCELFDQPYAFSDPLTMAATLDKGVAKRIVRDAGIATAPFAMIERPEEAYGLSLAMPAFVKPVAEGTGKGCEVASKVFSEDELAQATVGLTARFGQPVIVESFLPGREFTVGVLGTGTAAKVIATMEIVLPAGADLGVYSYATKEACESRVIYRLATDDEAMRAADAALAAHRVLGCRDAARFDFRSDAKGQPHFLEANPIAGLHPTHSDLPMLTEFSGRSYDWLIGRILASAAARYGLAFPSAPQAKLSSVA